MSSQKSGRVPVQDVRWETSKDHCTPNQRQNRKESFMHPFFGESSISCLPDHTVRRARKLEGAALPHPDGWFRRSEGQRPPRGRRGGDAPWTGAHRYVAGLLDEFDTRLADLEKAGTTRSALAAMHLQSLLAAGLSDRQIAELAGITTERLRRGTVVDTAVLTVSLLPVDDRKRTPALGARRRLRALIALGWDVRAIAESVAAAPDSLYKVANDDHRQLITPRLWWQVCEAYESLSGTPGPSSPARELATSRGWVAPLAWDDEDLDDPAGLPYTPESNEGCVDEIAVQRVLDSDPAEHGLTLAEQYAVLEAYVDNHSGPLTERRWSTMDLARMLNKSPAAAEKQLSRWKRRNGLRVAPATSTSVRRPVRQDQMACRAVS